MSRKVLRVVYALGAIGGMMGAVAADEGTAQARNATFSDVELRARWKELTPEEADQITKRHIMGLMRAVHFYHDVHGTFPPAVVPNPKIPASKRLSGFVLLLPFLGAEPNVKEESFFEPGVVELAKEIHKSMDLTKGWDDPANLPAAKTIMPALLSPSSGAFRNKQGFAASHFVFVTGSENGFDGAFPGEKAVSVAEITDGVAMTWGLAQISHDLGPWTAGGLSTNRQVHPPAGKKRGSVGGTDPNRCWFSACDGSAYLIHFDAAEPKCLQGYATRAGQEQPCRFARAP